MNSVRLLHTIYESQHGVNNSMRRLTINPFRSVVGVILLLGLTSITPCILQAASPLTYYPNRAAFNTAKPGLPIETLSNANIAYSCYSGSQYCSGLQPSPLNSSTNYALFSAGSILPGITITTLLPQPPGTQNLLVLNTGAVRGGTKSVGTYYFGDTLLLNFAPGVLAVAADIFACCQGTSPPVPADAGDFTVSFYNGTTLLGSKTITVASGIGFFGVTSTIAITSVRILYTTDEAVTGVDNIAFPAPNIVRNGSFENPTNTWLNTSCNYMALRAGATKIPWWSVTSTTINEIVWGKTLTCDGHTAAANTFFLDLTGFVKDSTNGAAQQTLNNLTVGHGYNLSLDVVTDRLPPLVSIGGATVTLKAGTTFKKGSDVWTIYTGSFITKSANPVLVIKNQGVQVEFVDNVVITAQ